MLSESEIYMRMKKWLTTRDWKILGGEPPGGTNNIPIIEMKTAERHKGSYGSRKIDLVAYCEGYFILIELKSKYSESDVLKLDSTVRERAWRIALLRALDEKMTLERAKIHLPHERQIYTDSPDLFIKAVGFNYTGKLGKADFVTFIPSGSIMKAIIGSQVNENVRKLVETKFEGFENDTSEGKDRLPFI